MEAAEKADETSAAADRACQLERRFDGLGAALTEEAHRRPADRIQRSDLLRERDLTVAELERRIRRQFGLKVDPKTLYRLTHGDPVQRADLEIAGAAAVILSAIGMHGMIAHDVAQRRREMGIRMALGAAPRQVVAAITLRGVAIAGVGIAVGLPAAWALGRVIAAALPGLASMQLGWIAILAVLLSAIAAISSSLPALNAARIRPARVLQTD